jgi:hypothetical protein
MTPISPNLPIRDFWREWERGRKLLINNYESFLLVADKNDELIINKKIYIV